MTGQRVYLVRHGEAESPGPAGDAARRLTASGRACVERHVRALRRELAVTRIATSPLLRAVETAQLFGAALDVAVEETAALASGRSAAEELLALAAELGPGALLVGHNPELAMAIALAAGRDVAVPPGTVAALELGSKLRLAWCKSP